MRGASPWLARGVKAALMAGILVLLWRVADGPDAIGRVLSVTPHWAIAALLVLTLQTVLSALRWRLTAAQLGIELSRRTALREYYLSQLFNQALPGGILGDAGRAVRARAPAGLLPSAQAVLFERLAGQIALFLVFLVAAIPMLTLPSGFEVPAWLRGVILTVLLTGGLALLVLGRPGLWPTGAERAFRSPFLHALTARDVRVRQIFLSLGTALCNIVAFALCAKAVGVTFPVLAALVLIPLVLLSMLVPLTIGGWGLREGVAVIILPLAGMSVGEALATSVVFGLGVAIASLPGVLAVTRPASPKAARS